MLARATANLSAVREDRVPQRGGGSSARWRCAKLWLRIHWDGFRFDPAGYLQGAWWRMRGLKVRSRHRLSSLIGRSPRAYDFWVSCREPGLRPRGLPSADTSITPVIDCRASSAGLDRTLGSLGGASAIIIGEEGAAGARRVAQPGDLAEHVGHGAWLCPIRCGDMLAGDALSIYEAAIADNPDARIIYADDDLVSDGGRRTEPHFKPQWNPELFEHHDFLTGACVVRATAADLKAEESEEWSTGLIARQLAVGTLPVHLPFVLHHRLSRPAPQVPDKPSLAAMTQAPLVSVIVPTRNQAELLKACIAGVRAADYPAVELIVIDNDSDDPTTLSFLEELKEGGAQVLRIPGAFNYSALNNEAAGIAQGEILLFLNNDVETTEGDWLSLLVAHAVKDSVGAVGAQLVYPDGTIQHAGVYTGIGGGAGHAHRFLGADQVGYFERARLPQRVSAVTAACLAVGREKFLSVGGFDEIEFPVAFNDVDLCLKLNTAGWHTIYEPRAKLVHHESKSRGSDRAKGNRARFAGELAALKRKWRTDVRSDPFHHPQLSPFCEQFFVAV